jgi:hypothetical protein
MRSFIHGIANEVGGLLLTGYAMSGAAPAYAETWQAKAGGPATSVGGLLMAWIEYRQVKRGQS